MSVSVMCFEYFELEAACADNTIMIHNGLTPPNVLNVHCNDGKKDLFVRNLRSGRSAFIWFTEKDGQARKVYTCLLRHGPKFESFYNVQVYRGASLS